MHIVNYSARESILFITVLGLRYETTEDQMRFLLAGLRTMLLAHPKVADTEPRVRFAGFGDYSLNVEIRVDINTGDMTKFREIREDLNLRIMEVVKDSGTGFAFPSSTVYHARDTGIDAERQQSAEQQVEEWRTGNELPFPHFSIDYRINNRNTLDYPPAGSPDAKQEKK
jgi:MscS family membrane protein